MGADCGPGAWHARRWVLLPGTLCTGAVFDPLLDALGVPRSARRVVALDQPSIEAYRAPLAALCDRETVLCGFSLGAIVAAHLADRIEAADLVLFGLNPRADDPLKREGRLALLADVERLGGEAALATRLAPPEGPDPQGTRAHLLAMAAASGGWIAAQTRLALERPGALPALRRAVMPVTCLTGTRDTQAPLALAAEAVAAAPHARLLPLPDLGHYALVEDPRACATVLGAARPRTPDERTLP